VQLSYESSPLSRRRAIYPFGVGADPVLRTGERIAALIYKRGDVSAARSRVNVMLDSETMFNESAGWAYMPEGISRLALLTGFGLVVDRAAPARDGDYLVMGAASGRLATALANAATRLGLPGADAVHLDELRRRGLIPASNGTDFGRQVYESDTGQLVLEARERRFRVDTPRTALVTWAQGDATVGPLTVQAPTVPGLVAISSLDDRPISQSRRMLLFVLTDAMNTGMEFADAARTQLRVLGGLPVLLQTVQMDVLVRHDAAAAGMRCYALGLNGERREELPIKRVADGWRIPIDTAALAKGPATTFEVAAD
jgi:hypothetical protein